MTDTRRIFEIAECEHCPYLAEATFKNSHVHICVNHDRVVGWRYLPPGIPDWCELPTAEQYVNEAVGE